MNESFLIVRLGSLGDIIHALPVAAALRERFPTSSIDWLVDARYDAILRLVPVVDRLIVIEASGRATGAWGTREERFAGWTGIPRALAWLRKQAYDVAFDLQGLVKSAVLARLSGARRVVGFGRADVREWPAHICYTERAEPGGAVHVIDKNLAALSSVGISGAPRRFPIGPVSSRVADLARERLGLRAGERFAVVSAGGGWPNKRWAPRRYGAAAAAWRMRRGLATVVVWGPGEDALAGEVVAHSEGAAVMAPPTNVADLVSLVREAAVVVAGDTGPLHIAAAVGTPVVAIFGPSDPARNGPWDPADIIVSRYNQCTCHYQRRCREARPCLDDIAVEDVVDAVDRRLSATLTS